MTLKDISNGPSWVMWMVLIIFVIITIILLSCHGANLVAGYNTASEEEKQKYNAKKISRVVGAGFSVITVMIFVMTLWEAILPAWIAYVFLIIVIIDCIAMIVLTRTLCKIER